MTTRRSELNARRGELTAKRGEPRYIILLALLLGSQPVATDLYLPALPAIAAELGNPALTLTGLMLAFGFAQLILGPMSDRYGEVSDALRTTTNAMLARTVKPVDGVADIDTKLRRVMR